MMRLIVDSIWKRIRPLFLSVRVGDYIPIGPDGFWEIRSAPTRSFNKAVFLFNQLRGEVIIEIGTGIHGKMAGNSILVWLQRTSAKRVIAVDLDEKRIEEVKDGTSQYAQVECVVTDGIIYLKQFSSTIDLLYLDFWVPDPEGSLPGTGRAEVYREAYQAAKDKMSPHSIILIDDTDHIHPWKHTYIIPDAREDGYKVLYSGRQTLLVR